MYRIFSISCALFLLLSLNGCSSAAPAPLPPETAAAIETTTAIDTTAEETTTPAAPAESAPSLNPDNTVYAEEPASIAALVNKSSHLRDDYIPEDLVEVNIPFSFSEKSEKRCLRQEAAGQLEALAAAAQTEGLAIYGVSGYRSYSTQDSIFAYNVSRFGSEQEANRISARPGESEHQTGLAMDVSAASINYGLEQSFDQTAEYAWLKDKAHLYGFVIRYPQDKEEITGYMYEPWHIRYFGVDLATTLYNEGLTYEEFLATKI